MIVNHGDGRFQGSRVIDDRTLIFRLRKKKTLSDPGSDGNKCLSMAKDGYHFEPPAPRNLCDQAAR